MKTKNMIWAALSMTAALVMTACSNDDNTVETPTAQQAIVKTIPYSVTVNGSAGTRATVDNDMKTLKFAAGDKLYITGMYISGVLTLKSGDEGKSSGATFEGDLTYTGGGSPASNLPLAAALVGTNNQGWNIEDGKATTFSYLNNAYCSSVNDAVEQYSNLTGTSKYSAKSFTLTQQTAFLNFEITFEDGTTAGTELSAVVKNNNGEATLCTANVTTTTEGGKVVAKFVLPVMSSATTLNGATVKMGDKAALTINDASLTGKVYNVKKTYAAATPSLNITSPAVGQVIGSDGKNYDAGSVPTGVTAVAMIAYVSGSNGLAVALDYLGSGSYEVTYANVQTQLDGLTAFSGGTWRLATKDEWVSMLVACKVDGDSESFPTTKQMTCSGFWTKMAAAGWSREWALECWTSTTKGDKLWSVLPQQVLNKMTFRSTSAPTDENYILPVLAF